MRIMDRIPRKDIQHLIYDPDALKEEEEEVKSVPEAAEPEVKVKYVASHKIEDIKDRWRSFSGERIYDALRDAEEYACEGGFVPTMPEFVEALTKVPVRNKLWRNGYVTQTEEYIGIDHEGKFVNKGDHVSIVVHGEGITPTRIKEEYDPKNPGEYSITLTEGEFDDLLSGILPNENTVKLHTFKEFMNKRENLPAYYGIALDYKDIRKLPTHIYNKKDLLVNPLIIARCGGKKDAIEKYFEKAMSAPGIKGTTATGLPNFHKYRFVEPEGPEGWKLEHNKGFYGSGQYDKNTYVASVPAPGREINESLLDKVKSKIGNIF